MFYGWKIVGVTFVANFISVGFVFYSYGVFFPALADEFHGNRLGVSVGLAIMNIATAVFAPFLGRALDRLSIRNIMCCGALLMALGFFLSSRITALWQFYLILISVLGIGAATMGGLPCSKLVINWFVRRRGMALGIATMGISFSGVVMAPLATELIANIGWRNTFLTYAIATPLVVIPLVWFAVVNRPEDRGLTPDGLPYPSPHGTDDAQEPIIPLAPGDQFIDHPGHIEWSSKGALRARNFWVIAITMGLCFCAAGSTLTHFVTHARDLGYPIRKGALIISTMAGMGVLGKIVFGLITDYMQTRYALWLSMAFQASGMVVLLMADSYPALIAGGALFGLGMGGLVPLSGVLVGDTFGRNSFGKISGLMGPCMLPLQTLGLPYAGLVQKFTGSYTFAFQTFVGFYVVAACTLLLLKPPGTEAGEPAPLDSPGDVD